MIRSTYKGFALYEVIACVALVALSSAVAFEGLRAARRASVAHDVARVCAILTTALLEACVREQTTTLRIEGTPCGVVGAEDACVLSPGVLWAAPPGAYGPPAQPHSLIKKPITCAHNTIVCHPTGAATAGTLYLGSPEYNEWWAITLSVGESRPIRTYRYERSAWVFVS